MLAIVLLLIVWRGWRRDPWWLPMSVLVAVSPLILLKLGALTSWRPEAHLAASPLNWLAGSFLLNFLLFEGAYWLGRGLRHALSPKGQLPTDAPSVYRPVEEQLAAFEKAGVRGTVSVWSKNAHMQVRMREPGAS